MNSKDCPMRAACKDRFRKGESACAKCKGATVAGVDYGADEGEARQRWDDAPDYMAPAGPGLNGTEPEDEPEEDLKTYKVEVTFEQTRRGTKVYTVEAKDMYDAEDKAGDLAHDDAEEGNVDFDDCDDVDYNVMGVIGNS